MENAQNCAGRVTLVASSATKFSSYSLVIKLPSQKLALPTVVYCFACWRAYGVS